MNLNDYDRFRKLRAQVVTLRRAAAACHDPSDVRKFLDGINQLSRDVDSWEKFVPREFKALRDAEDLIQTSKTETTPQAKQAALTLAAHEVEALMWAFKDQLEGRER